MSIGFIFWLLMILILVFGGVGRYSGFDSDPRFRTGGGVILYVLLFLIGWQVFGFAIHR